MGPGLVKQQRQEITEAMAGQPIKSKFTTAIRPVSILPNVIELSYYANTMILHYVIESAVGKNSTVYTNDLTGIS